MDEQDLKKTFAAHKIDVPDEGFTERVIRQLPERKSILPQIVMTVFIMIGLALMFAITGITPLLEQINRLTTSISRLQVPPPSAIITYISLISLTGIIGYAITLADTG